MKRYEDFKNESNETDYLTEERTGDPQTRNNIIVDEELYNKLSN